MAVLLSSPDYPATLSRCHGRFMAGTRPAPDDDGARCLFHFRLLSNSIPCSLGLTLGAVDGEVLWLFCISIPALWIPFRQLYSETSDLPDAEL
jgi:hypothetical protein